MIEKKPDIDISFNNETPFCVACENNNLSVAQLLYEIKPDIYISADN